MSTIQAPQFHAAFKAVFTYLPAPAVKPAMLLGAKSPAGIGLAAVAFFTKTAQMGLRFVSFPFGLTPFVHYFQSTRRGA